MTYATPTPLRPRSDRRRTRAISTLLVASALVTSACATDPSPPPPSPPASVVPPVASASPTASGPSDGDLGTARPSADPSRVVIPEPPGDLYDVPDPLPPGEPGDIVWAERVRAPEGAVAWRVLYHSRTIRGEPIAVSGLIVGPDGPAPPGGFPVVGYGHGTTGLADACAPSKAARVIDGGEGDGNGTGARTGALPLPALWEDGFVVAATDYEGLGTPGRHPYLVGGSEGRSILDAVRAATRLPDAHASSRTIVLGTSQGGHAALFAGELAAAYAPDVDLAGVVALAPGAELAQAALLLAGNEAVVGYAVAIGAGFEAAYRDVVLEEVLTPAAARRLDVLDEGCMGEVLDTFARPAREVIRFDRIVQPPWPGLLEENTPGNARTPAPIFVGQGTADPLVVPELTDLLVERLCRTGDEVTYRRYPGAGHGGVAAAASADVRTWIEARLAAGSPAEDTCS